MGKSLFEQKDPVTGHFFVKEEMRSQKRRAAVGLNTIG